MNRAQEPCRGGLQIGKSRIRTEMSLGCIWSAHTRERSNIFCWEGALDTA
jgi:hypothetical protein